MALGLHREAVADAAQALRLGEPTDKRLYISARIHAHAAIVAASEARKTGRDKVSLVNHYLDQATEFAAHVAEANSSRRASRAALRDLLQDPAMVRLRRRLRSVELTGAVS